MSDKLNIRLRVDGSQVVEYAFPDFFAAFWKGRLSDLPGGGAPGHWHEEIELIAVISGQIIFNVNGTVEVINAGDGILINSKQMHCSFSHENAACKYICVLLHPMLLCVSHDVEHELVSPLLSDPSLPCIPLQGETPWKRDVINAVHEMYNCWNTPAGPLRVQSLLCGIWANVYENAEHCRRHIQKQRAQDKGLDALRLMTRYIHEHYQDKVTLEDLARAGFVSRSQCINLFREHLHDSPINYLISYRVELSVRLLVESARTVADIAYQVGFSSPSFFVSTFRKRFGCTPLEYRKDYMNRQNNLNESYGSGD